MDAIDAMLAQSSGGRVASDIHVRRSVVGLAPDDSFDLQGVHGGGAFSDDVRRASLEPDESFVVQSFEKQRLSSRSSTKMSLRASRELHIVQIVDSTGTTVCEVPSERMNTKVSDLKMAIERQTEHSYASQTLFRDGKELQDRILPLLSVEGPPGTPIVLHLQVDADLGPVPSNASRHTAVSSIPPESWGRNPSDRSSASAGGGERDLLQSGAFVCLWVMGIGAVFHILKKFKPVLQPVVLALCFVSILEITVQMLERILWKLTICVGLLVQKLMVLARMLWKKCLLCMTLMFTHVATCSMYAFRGCQGHKACCPGLPGEKDQRLVALAERAWRRAAISGDLDILRNFSQFRRKWKSSFAGKNTVFRFVSVILTLGTVLLIVLAITAVLSEQLSDMTNRIPGYRDQVMKAMQLAQVELLQLPGRLSFLNPQQRIHMEHSIQSAIDRFTSHSYVSEAETYVNSIITAALASTGGVLTQVTFFLLYTFLWLFEPLHINPDEENEPLIEWSEFHPSQPRAERSVSASSRKGNTKPLLKKETKEFQQASRSPSFFRRASMVFVGGTPVGHARSRAYSQVASTTAITSVLDPHAEMQEHLYQIMWQYFLLKVMMNGIFAFLCFSLLEWLNVDLSGLLGMACFFLAFIPELGTIISMILPVPFILLAPPRAAVNLAVAASNAANATLHAMGLNATSNTTADNGTHMPTAQELFPDMDVRIQQLMWVVGGMCAVKMVVSNGMESVVMGKNKVLSGALQNQETADEVKETHPVIILFAVVLAGEVWGPIGMLISVPMLSLIRLTFNLALYDPNKQPGLVRS